MVLHIALLCHDSLLLVMLGELLSGRELVNISMPRPKLNLGKLLLMEEGEEIFKSLVDPVPFRFPIPPPHTHTLGR